MGEQARRWALPGMGFWLLLGGCGQSDPAEAVGLLFEQPRLELGEMISGEERLVLFPFEVSDAPVRVNRFVSSCGCLDVELVSEQGEAFELGSLIPAGTRGELRAVWRTSGYIGNRESTVRLLGEGPGLPQTVRFSGFLKPWFVIEPEIASFAAADRDVEQELFVTVRGPEPFRLLDILASSTGIRVEGLPSAEPSTEQVVRLIREAGESEEGRRAAFLQLRSDFEGYSATIPVEVIVQSQVWVAPAKRYLLGKVVDRVITAPPLEFGAREGELEVLEVRSEGVEGVQLKYETIEAGKRFRLRLELPAGLASGPLRGTIHLRFAHRLAGRESLLEREIQYFGLASNSENSESQSR
jgi:hypothetical protein